MNKLLRSLLKAGVYFLEQSDRSTADMADRVKDRVQNLSRRARHAIYGQEDHTVRNAISFAAGIGLGIGVGMLFAPSPGEETRSSIVGKVHDFGDKLRERFSPEVKSLLPAQRECKLLAELSGMAGVIAMRNERREDMPLSATAVYHYCRIRLFNRFLVLGPRRQ